MEREIKLKLKEKLKEIENRWLKTVAKLCSVGVAVPSVTASQRNGSLVGSDSGAAAAAAAASAAS